MESCDRDKYEKKKFLKRKVSTKGLLHVNDSSTKAFSELNHTILERKESKITAKTDIFTGFPLGALLANNDLTGRNFLTAKQLHAKAFARALMVLSC